MMKTYFQDAWIKVWLITIAVSLFFTISGQINHVSGKSEQSNSIETVPTKTVASAQPIETLPAHSEIPTRETPKVQGKWVVDAKASAVSDTTSLQKAVNNAIDGDVIEVYPGTYWGSLSIPKSITIRGVASSNEEIKIQNSGGPVAQLYSGEVTFEKVTFVQVDPKSSGLANEAIVINHGTAIFKNARVISEVEVALSIEGGKVSASDTLFRGKEGGIKLGKGQLDCLRCEVSDSGGNGIFAVSLDPPIITIKDSSIVRNHSNGLMLASGGSASIENSIVSNNEWDGIVVRDPNTQLKITNCKITGNKEIGISIQERASVILQGSEVSGSGSGVMLVQYGDLKLNQSQIKDNRFKNVSTDATSKVSEETAPGRSTAGVNP